ncbi:hypothetical protein PLEOSDRAFT_1077263 [Pleurotus ostreatus PC15]|uniref:Threonine/serine exporter-like N-terminal domain-containing protein n=1 Tax=Pleurotus ostreatus (strain PC15) TaxID=1137138 RepID=A0A067NWA8_PLEO1|nr:hypothetical protein PLEOSDRAFT_1077263 [Pleurotus ostreatus PC15]
MDHTPIAETPPSPSVPSGSKTPRKVQWLDERETRLLDEQGLDPEAFETLAAALERHRSTSQVGSLHEATTSAHQNNISVSAEATTPEFSESNASCPPSPPKANVPDNYIDPSESAGVPLRDNPTSHAEKQAKQVVRAHTRKRYFAGLRRKAQPSIPGKSNVDDGIKKRDCAHPIDSIKDVEKLGEHESRRPMGGGVLSTLLTLYDHQQFPSGASTPSRRSSISEDGEDRDEGWRAPRNRRERASRGNDANTAPPSPLVREVNLDNPEVTPQRPKYHLPRHSLDSHMFRRSVPVPRDTELPHGIRTSDLTQNTSSSSTESATSRAKWGQKLRDLPFAPSVLSLSHGGWSGRSTPTTDDEEWRENEKRERRRKRKTKEIRITRHVAEIIKRQEFILKLARAMMMFGGPSNRLQAQIQSTARVLDIPLSCMYLPDVILISFDDNITVTSNVKLIRQSSALDLGKLKAAYRLYWKVIHDDLSVEEASPQLDELMCGPPTYRAWQSILIGGMCSSAICTVGFNGSFIDALVVYPLGALLVAIQLLSVRNELYSNVFEITIATLLSFLSAALAETHRFCYSAVASASVVLILPGFIVLSGALELMSRNIVAGSVRLCYAVMYSLFLGFGLAIGAEAYQTITDNRIVGAEDYTCVQSHDPEGMWYQQTPSIYWAFLSVPLYSFCLSMRVQMPWKCKEMILLVLISCIGWVTNHFTAQKFRNQNDISAAFGAFAVGVVSNVYGRFFSGNAFVVMITGILFQLPSGLGYGGLLTFASQQSSGFSTSYVSGFQTALQLISVGIGLSVGLGISLVVVHPIQSRRRAGGVFSL